MKLTGINIKGFKSFARETNIRFNERVTGIVGPNGSGKSNIVDAIRWVLGEQKPTELRLDHMPDVIFNGTNKIKKSSMAQVTLNFENTKNIIPTEYQEIAISRTLFSTGESEYRINDIPCRLKDIRNLFIDTGVGPDSYAIIALNMVEDILADNNDSRRQMFEQAAGISKFKKRKKETLNQLSITRADLERLDDLLFEIENNLKELEKQARKAKQFLNLKNQYKELSINLYLKKFDIIIESINEISLQVDKELTDYREIELLINNKEAQLQENKKNIVLRDKDLSDAQKLVNDHLDKLRSNESNKQIADQQIKFNTAKITDIETENQSIEKKLENLEVSFKKAIDRIEVESKKLNELESVFTASEKELNDIKLVFENEKSRIDEKNRLKKTLEDRKFDIQKNIAVLTSNNVNIEKDLEIKEKKIEALSGDIKDAETEVNELNVKLQLMEFQLNEFLTQKELRKEKLRILREKNDELQKTYKEKSRLLDARNNEFQLVRSMIDNMEGFPESIKFISKNYSDKIPLLTDLITTTENYKVALEAYLEPYLNYFVVNSSIEAINAINLLRKSQKGKANFFIIDNIKDVGNTIKEYKNFIPILDIVEFDQAYARLFNKLLSNVFVSSAELDEVNIDDEEVVIIDKTGSFIAGKNTISGGSLGLFEGKKIGRKQSLAEIKDRISKLESELNLIQEEINTNDLQSRNLTIHEQEENSEKILESINSVKLQISQVNYKFADKNKNLEILINEVKVSKRNLQLNNTRLVEETDLLTKTQDELTNLFSDNESSPHDINELMLKLSEQTGIVNDARIEVLKQRNLISVLEKDKEYSNIELQNINSRKSANKELFKSLSTETEKLQLKLGKLEEELIRQYKLKSQFEEQISELEKSYFENRNIVTESESEISNLKHQLTKSQYLINQLKEKQYDLEYNKKSITERLKIEFNADIKEFINLERPDEDELVLNDKVEKLRYRIDNFGEVNTLAIEAHDEMSVRYDKIITQKQDVLDAEKSLKKTISEIEKTATKLFLEAFEMIRESFKKVFTTLFTEGDTCDLILDDPENPLDSRITIIAKPKGKRPKTISQLSGGEKTLTAIALLFSLYLFKPAPFCIFDEVDAPLDDANIQKFNNIIREFSKDSQFIVVTHNKSTMVSVDVLYGVFMQEPGVSEVASVDFRTYEEPVRS